MLGVSLSSFNGLSTVTTKYVIKINEFPSFGFCSDNILVIVLCAIGMWINSAVTTLYIFKTYDKSNAFVKNKYKSNCFFLREEILKLFAGIAQHSCHPWPCVGAADE